MENREKVVDAWWEQGNVVFPMCWTYKENWTFGVFEDMTSSNDGSLTIVG